TSQLRERFARQVKQPDLKDANLVLNIRTRWNPTYDMLARALEMHEALDAIIYLNKKLKAFKANISSLSINTIVSTSEPYTSLNNNGTESPSMSPTSLLLIAINHQLQDLLYHQKRKKSTKLGAISNKQTVSESGSELLTSDDNKRSIVTKKTYSISDDEIHSAEERSDDIIRPIIF
ncbi:17703_t:CDS:2, partial [Dentiscutata erythropus]